MDHLHSLLKTDHMLNAFGIDTLVKLPGILDDLYFLPRENNNSKKLTSYAAANLLYFLSTCKNEKTLLDHFPDNSKDQVIVKCVALIQERINFSAPDKKDIRDLESLTIGKGYVKFSYSTGDVIAGCISESVTEVKVYSGDWFRKYFLLYYDTKFDNG